MAAHLCKPRASSFAALRTCSRPQTSLKWRRSTNQIPTTFASSSTSFQRWSMIHSKSRCGERAFHSSASLSATKDPYKVLGVDKNASPAEIKKVFFDLARKYHPDQNPDKGAREKFVEIQEAYDILKDEGKRTAYDQYGAASQQPGFNPDSFSKDHPFASAFSGFQGFGTSFGDFDGQAGDLFSHLFGMGARSGRGRASQGDDIEAQVSLSFLDACKGVIRTLNVTPIANCPTCAGSGIKPGARKSTCNACGGSGSRTFIIDSGFQMAGTCVSCYGTGYVVHKKDQCSTCSGEGKVYTKKSVNVTIPPGAEDGMFIRVPGAGHAAPSKGQHGDLLVRVNVAPSKLFRRQGANLYHSARIPFHTALLGGKARVPTTDGEVEIRIPGGTQPGEEMVLRGRGVPSVRGPGVGDLFVSFQVQIPRTLTQHQRDILQQYVDDVEGRQPNKKRPSSKDSTKDSELNEMNTNDDARQGEDANHTDEKPDEDMDREKRRATA